jgi:predicted O-methyltransferase YrrM
MNSLNSAPLSELLSKLFAAAEIADASFRQDAARIPPEERRALLSSETEYKALYGRAKDAYLAVSPETGKLLYLLARTSGARAVIEFGTSFGLSTLYLAAALRDNGGGRVISAELEASKAAKARENFRAAGLADLIEVREGDALTTLAVDLPERVDLLLLDGAKGLYPKILDKIEPRLREGAIVVADNADSAPKFLERVRASTAPYVSLPFGGDVEVSMFTGRTPPGR